MAFKEQLFAVLCVSHQKQGKDKDGTGEVCLPLSGVHVILGPACSSVLFLSRPVLLSKACSTCDCGLRCKCDRSVGKDVRLVSAHITWGELEDIWMFLAAKNVKGMERGFLLRPFPPCQQ